MLANFEVVLVQEHHPCAYLDFLLLVIIVVDKRRKGHLRFVLFAELPEDENEEELGDEGHDSYASLSAQVLFVQVVSLSVVTLSGDVGFVLNKKEKVDRHTDDEQSKGA